MIAVTATRQPLPPADRQGAGGAIRAAAVLLMVIAALHSVPVIAAPAPCDLRVTIQFTPDVPKPTDTGFLSSLLSDHPGYRLTVVQPAAGSGTSGTVLELTGIGPEDECQKVLATIRKDSRVQSVQIYRLLP